MGDDVLSLGPPAHSLLTQVVAHSLVEPTRPSFVSGHPDSRLFGLVMQAMCALSKVLDHLSMGMHTEYVMKTQELEDEERRLGIGSHRELE
jgi:hypothetical protein